MASWSQNTAASILPGYRQAMRVIITHWLDFSIFWQFLKTFFSIILHCLFITKYYTNQIHCFLYKNTFYKNSEAQISPKLRTN